MIYDCEELHNLKELKNYHKLELLASYYNKSAFDMLDDILSKIEIEAVKEENNEWKRNY